MKTKKIFSWILTTVMSVGLLLSAACSDQKKPTTETGGPSVTVTEGDTAFVQKGKSEYKLVVSSEAEDELLLAQEEMLYFVELITGCKMQVVSDRRAVYDEDSKYVSLGRNELFEQTGIDVTKEALGESGYIIRSVGDMVFITGDGEFENGTLFGVYEFLKYALDLEIYTGDCFTYTDAETVFMPVFDVKVVPDIPCYYSYWLRNDYTYLNRMRMTNKWARQHWQLTGHAEAYVLRLTTEYTKHGDWLTPSETLCYSATEMWDVFARNYITLLEAYPETTRAFVGIADAATQCNCARCQAMSEEYGTNTAGRCMIFWNYVLDIVTKHFEETAPDRYIEYAMWAYEGVFEPPVHKDEKGNIVPDHEAVIPHPKLRVMYTPILLDNMHSITEASNKANYESFLGWATISTMLEGYGYNFYTRAPSVAAGTFLSFEENIRMYHDYGMTYYFEEGPGTLDNFGELKIYAQSNLCRDTSLSYDDLAHKFTANYYGPAGEIMTELYDFTKGYYASNRGNMPGTCQTAVTTVYSEDFLQEDYLNIQIKLCEEAEAVLEPLKATDEKAYYEYLWRVRRESFCARVNRLKVYSANMSETQINEEVRMIRGWLTHLRFGDLAAQASSPDRGAYSVWFDNLIA